MQALGWVVAPDRKRSHHRGDLVAERAVLFVGAHAHRYQRPQLELLGVEAAGAQVAGQGSGDGREDDVVDRAAELVLYPLQLVEVGARPCEAPVGTDLDVKGRGRGR